MHILIYGLHGVRIGVAMNDGYGTKATGKAGAAGIPIGDKGFTLIELMIVVAIIGILAATGSFAYMHARERALIGACVASLGGYKTGIEGYRSDNQGYPPEPISSFDDLKTVLGDNMSANSASTLCEFVSYESPGPYYTLTTRVRRSSGNYINIILTENGVTESE